MVDQVKLSGCIKEETVVWYYEMMMYLKVRLFGFCKL